jgi:hypothetical protein
MRRALQLRRHMAQSRRSGYAILIVLLMLALLTIVLMRGAPAIAIQIRHEREEETIHRANQYVVAIRRFYHKFGRYPNTLEELQSTNNFRFLRRQYKDPITGNDFRLLHPGEATLALTGFFGQNLTGTNGGPGVNLLGTPMTQPGNSNQNNSNSTQSNNSQSNEGSDSLFQPLTSNSSGQALNAGGTAGNQSPSSSNSQNGNSLFGNADSLGGGPIIGVAGTSKQKSLKVVNGKEHYNDWQFVYDPRMETLQGVGPAVGAGVAGGTVQPGAAAPGNAVQPQQQQPQAMPMTPQPPQ